VLFNWYCHCQLQETCKILDRRQRSRKTQAKSFPVLQALKPVKGVLEPALDTYEQVQKSLVPSLALQNRQASTQSFSLGQEPLFRSHWTPLLFLLIRKVPKLYLPTSTERHCNHLHIDSTVVPRTGETWKYEASTVTCNGSSRPQVPTKDCLLIVYDCSSPQRYARVSSQHKPN
jgi:hypothetical protein